jgi:hypothetical protein
MEAKRQLWKRDAMSPMDPVPMSSRGPKIPLRPTAPLRSTFSQRTLHSS